MKIKDYIIIFFLALALYGTMTIAYQKGIDKAEYRMSYEYYKPDTAGVEIVHLDADPYDIDIKVLIGTDLTKIAALARYYTFDPQIKESDFFVRGLTIWPSDSTPGIPVIWIPSIPKTPEQQGILSHEFVHITHLIMQYAGVELCEHSEEAYAYENGYLIRQFYQKTK